MRKLFASLAVVFAIAVFLNVPSASAVSWTNWTSITTGASGSGSGSLTVGPDLVGVSLSGRVLSFVDGTSYYTGTYNGVDIAAVTYGGLAPSDLIQESTAGSINFNFSRTVHDLYLSIVSVGSSGNPVTYTFPTSVYTVESFGPNDWGYTGYTINGSLFTGREFNGILKFSGAFDSFSFSFSPYENWHGFNVGIAAVPEPATLFLIGLGLIGLAGARRSKRF